MDENVANNHKGKGSLKDYYYDISEIQIELLNVMNDHAMAAPFPASNSILISSSESSVEIRKEDQMPLSSTKYGNGSELSGSSKGDGYNMSKKRNEELKTFRFVNPSKPRSNLCPNNSLLREGFEK